MVCYTMGRQNANLSAKLRYFLFLGLKHSFRKTSLLPCFLQ